MELMRSEWKEFLPFDVQEYLEKVQFNPQETALFLIGVLAGKLRGDRVERRLAFYQDAYRGLSLPRVMEIANLTFEELLKEGLLTPENELIYALAKRLLDEERKNWNLDLYHNMYFILSGIYFAKKKSLCRHKEVEL